MIKSLLSLFSKSVSPTTSLTPNHSEFIKISPDKTFLLLNVSVQIKPLDFQFVSSIVLSCAINLEFEPKIQLYSHGRNRC